MLQVPDIQDPLQPVMRLEMMELDLDQVLVVMAVQEVEGEPAMEGLVELESSAEGADRQVRRSNGIRCRLILAQAEELAGDALKDVVVGAALVEMGAV